MTQPEQSVENSAFDQPQHKPRTPTRLSRNAFEVSGDLPDQVARNVFYATWDLDGRFMNDRQREYTLTLGYIETARNIRDVNHFAQGDTMPESVTIETFGGTSNEFVVSRRTFANLKFRNSSIGYSLPAKDERPVHKCVYEATLVSSEFFPIGADDVV